MAKKPAAAAAANVPVQFTEADFVAHEQTYKGFLSAVKLIIIATVLAVVGLYFILFGGASIFGGFLIILSLVVPPILGVVSRK